MPQRKPYRKIDKYWNEKQLAREFGSGLNDVIGRGALAGLLGAPADIMNLGENGIRGLLGLPQVTAWGGSEHIGRKLEQAGLVSSERRPKTELLASLVSPAGVAKTVLNAPKTARLALKALDNLDAPSTFGRGLGNSQVGAIDFDLAPFRQRAYAKQDLMDRGAYSTNKAYERYISVDKVDGLDPAPATWVDDAGNDRNFERGQVIKDSIEVAYDPNTDGYQLINGNHRMQQAMLDGDKQIRAFVEPHNGYIGTDGTLSPTPVGNIAKLVAPQDEALRVAQANAAKPVSEGGLGLRMDNTPEERAAAMGFDTDAYHGRYKDYAEVKDGRTLYATQDPEYASIYTNPSASSMGGKAADDFSNLQPNVMPVKLRSSDILDTRTKSGKEVFDKEFYMKYGNGSPLSERGLPDWVDAEGFGEMYSDKGLPYKGVWADEGGIPMDDGSVKLRGASAAMFDPAAIRSRFAAFDPMRKDSGDLLAGLAPLGLGALIAQPKDRKKKKSN